MKINPALLVDNLNEFQRQFELAASYTDEVDIDIIDWQRTPKKTITVEQALSVITPLIINMDLMLNYPEADIKLAIKDPRVNRIIVSLECQQDIAELLKMIKENNKKPALSINPNNTLADFEKYLPLLELVQIFTIEPGAQGNQFLSERLELIKQIKDSGFTGLIEVDGGFNTDTAPEFLKYPLDIISVGSALSRAQDPKAAFIELTDLLNLQ